LVRSQRRIEALVRGQNPLDHRRERGAQFVPGEPITWLQAIRAVGDVRRVDIFSRGQQIRHAPRNSMANAADQEKSGEPHPVPSPALKYSQTRLLPKAEQGV
jgi:hypothetical protein